MYENTDLTISHESIDSDYLTNLQKLVFSAATLNYQDEKQIIDNDNTLPTKDKINSRRNSLLFWTGVGMIVYFIPKVCRYFEGMRQD